MSIFAVAMHWAYLWSDRGALLAGLLVSLKVGVASLVCSVAVGLLVAVARMSRTPFRWLAAGYVNVGRGAPSLVTAFWVYFGLAQAFSVNFSVFMAGVVTLTLLYSSILGEIFRASLEAVPPGQRDAGTALGMGSWGAFIWVVVPQATKIAIPNVGTMFIAMTKDTSVLSVIGLTDLMGTVQTQAAANLYYFPLLTAALVLYVTLTFAIDFTFRAVEKTMQTPPRGAIPRLLTLRRRRRIAAVVARAQTG